MLADQLLVEILLNEHHLYVMSLFLSIFTLQLRLRQKSDIFLNLIECLKKIVAHSGCVRRL